MLSRVQRVTLCCLVLIVSLGVFASEPSLRIRVLQRTPGQADEMPVTHLTLRDGAVCLADEFGQCLSQSMPVRDHEGSLDSNGVLLERDEKGRVISADYLGYTYLVDVPDSRELEAAAALRDAVDSDWLVEAGSPHRMPISVILGELAKVGYVPSEIRVLTNDGDDVATFVVSLTR